MALLLTLMAIAAAAASAEAPSPFPLHWDYPSEAANMYMDQLNARPACRNATRGAKLPSCCARSRSPASCAPDEWALAAALLYKHTKHPFWKAQAIGQLANFTASWKAATKNGATSNDRSGEGDAVAAPAAAPVAALVAAPVAAPDARADVSLQASSAGRCHWRTPSSWAWTARRPQAGARRSLLTSSARVTPF